MTVIDVPLRVLVSKAEVSTHCVGVREKVLAGCRCGIFSSRGASSDVTASGKSSPTLPQQLQLAPESVNTSKMLSVLLLVFLLQLFIHLLNTVGKQTVNDLVRFLSTSSSTL